MQNDIDKLKNTKKTSNIWNPKIKIAKHGLFGGNKVKLTKLKKRCFLETLKKIK